MDSPKDWMREYPHHLEDSVILQATPESLFSFLDDHRNLGAHMSGGKSAMLGMGGMTLKLDGQRGKKTFVVFESRGKKEDADLELEFRRLMDRTKIIGMPETFEFLTASKKTNSSGLQLADMVARPLGLHVLRPGQSNRALDVIMEKLRRSPQGEVNGWGLKLLP